ncbi:MAG: cytochrome c biogenesis protein CcdA [Synechococcales cyanobacterium]
MAWQDQWQVWLYQMQQWAEVLVSGQLQHLSPLSLAVMVLAGVLSSFSPCMLSMLPIMVGYVGGYGQGTEGGPRAKAGLAVGLSLGVATTLMGLGLGAALLGRLYGQTGSLWVVVVGGVTLIMGLNLLEVIEIPLPQGLAEVSVGERIPAGWRAYLIGLLFGVTASPCSTPVLVALLAWVSQSRDPWLGAILLLAYALGLMLPLLLVGFFTGVMTHLLSLRRWTRRITWVSGLILVMVGTLTLVNVWL